MISPETIALVKERTDLVALIGESVRLTRRGRSFTGLCPFHKEKTPSFHVNPERGFFHCFGCKESGSGVDFLMKAHGMSFPEAVRELASKAGIEVDDTATTEDQRRAEAARRSKEDLYNVNDVAAAYFENMLGLADDRRRHPLAHYAIEELQKRGMPPLHQRGEPADGRDSDELERWLDTAQAFRIGYAPHAWDGLASYLREQGLSAAMAEKVGLVVPRSTGTGHYDRFRHRLMFAVVDVMGRIVAFSGRALPDPTPEELADLGAGVPQRRSEDDGSRGGPPKYINSPESPIYAKGDQLFGLYQAKQAIRQSGRGLLVEGNFDVFALHARGEQRVVAPLGTAFTAGQASLLKRFAPATTVLFDGDSAGRKATRAARGACNEAGLEARVAQMPHGMDPDDFARQHGMDALSRVIDSAKGMIEYLIDDALEGDGFGGASLAEQVARVRAVAKLLSEEDDPNLRSLAKLYADRLSSRLIVGGRSPTDLRQLEKLIEDATKGPTEAVRRSRETTDDAGAPPEGPGPDARPRPPSGARGPQSRSPARVLDISLSILGVAMEFPSLLGEPEVARAVQVLEGDCALGIAALRQTPDLAKNGEDFLAHLPHSIHSFAAGRLASPLFEDIEEARAELLANARKLKNLSTTQDNAAIVEQLARGGGAADTEAEDALLQQVRRATREKRGLNG